MKRKVYPNRPASKTYPGNNVNYMVLWVRSGYRAQIIDDMYDKEKELCWHYVRENKNNSDFAGGKLIAVPIKYKSKHETT